MKHTLLYLLPLLLLAACSSPQDNEPVAPSADTLAVAEPMEQGLFATYNTDADVALTQEEFVTGYAESGHFADYDANADGALDEAEFAAYAAEAPAQAGAYASYDADGDGRITQDEFAAGLFRSLDANADGQVTSDEFAAFEAAANEPVAEPLTEMPAEEAPAAPVN